MKKQLYTSWQAIALTFCLLEGGHFLFAQEALAYKKQSPKIETSFTKTGVNSKTIALKEALKALKEHYNVDIVFGDKTVETFTISSSEIDYQKNIETNLSNVLRSSGLKFKKMKNGSYLILSKNDRRTAAELPVQNALPLNENTEIQATKSVEHLAAIKMADISVKGIVSDEKGEKLPGVSITVKGTTRGTTTNIGGEYEISVADNKAILVISYIGYQIQEIVVGNRTMINIVLQIDTKALDEVVVTGYSTQRKKDLTGAVSIVNMDNAKSVPAAGIDQALQGRVAGVNVMNSNVPGGGVAIRIRGIGTINSNDPLYIIDGIPVTGNINSLNPSDIESIQVLKDASSASIYGARAANGVVIITTRTAKQDKAQVIYDGYVGVQQAAKLPQLLDAQQFGDLWFLALKNGGQTPPTGNPYGIGTSAVIPEYLVANDLKSGNTNWFKEIFSPALVQSHTLSLLNGDAKGRTALNVGYFDQKGMIDYTGFKRYSARFNADYSLWKKLKIGEFANITYTQSQSPSENTALGSTITSVYFADPLLPIRDEKGNFAGPPLRMPIGGRNPLAILNGNKDNNATKWKILGKVFAELELFKDLTLKTNYAIDYTNFNTKDFNPTYSEGTQVNAVNSLSVYNSSLLVNTWTNLLNYKKSIQKNNLEVLAGAEFILTSGQNQRAGRSGFPSNDVNGQQLNAGQLLFTNSGSGFKSSLWSQFGKINYDFDDTYLASFTLRNDATSKLAIGRNSQVFSAFSLGWRLSNLGFLKNKSKINDLKLRYGWGQTGNQEIIDYATYTTYALDLGTTYYDINGANNSSQPGYSQQRIGNPALVWETSTQSNIGLDLAAFDNKLTFSVEYFTKNTKDLLVQPKIPATFGVATPPFINGGSMQNKGIEIELGYRNKVTKDFSYSIDGNFSYIKNKLTDLAPELSFIPSPVSNNLTRNLELQRSVVGLPIASFYGYNSLGIFKTQAEVDAHAAQTGKAIGRLKFEDTNDDGVVDDKDRQFLGSPIPTFNYGFNLKLNYKNFDFWTFFQGVGGNKIFDFTRVYSDFFTSPSLSNKNIRVLEAWTPDRPDAAVPMLTTLSTNNDIRPSSYFIKNGDFLRLKTVQIGYELPSKSLSGKVRFYVQAQNLFTFTKYDGLDPEVGLQNYSSDNRNLDMGVDRGLYPVARTFMVGASLKF
ncbi:SusC/RagA family TonB-linked outer membrane protein [Emticicia aquatilis]|uniref:SusC/RagA family TonB-linked outer membrane protein n=1 Tax=Emticicia aquatilis TaxID=1537369 RepID=A0A916YI65_9BACT|nr:TonB-dependent receptor [Emticicia aquatilis]GGD45761.1 SusC/RagA family TonB-linked outer membrane protein [Emticicia aquatilis]